MKHFPFLLAAFLTLLLWSCESDSQSQSEGQEQAEKAVEDTHTLQYTLENGESWMTKDQRVETTTLNAGTEEESVTRMKTVIVRKFHTNGIDKENAFNLTMTYNRVFAEYSGPGGEWMYDSEVPSTHRQAGGLEFLAGNSLEFRMDRATGQVFAMNGGNELLEKMTGDTSTAKLGNRLMLEQAMPEFYIFPDGDVPIGASWKRSGAFSSRYNVHYTNNFTLKSRDGQSAVLDISTGISPLEAEQAITGVGPDGSPIRHELVGTSTGQVTFESISGKTTSRSTTTEMSGDRLSLNTDGSEKGRTPIKITIQRDSELSLK